MSLILAIETSNPGAGEGATGIALGRLDSSLEVIACKPLQRGGDDELMPAIAQIVSEAGAQPNDLSRVGVSIGPGGFTGVRIAVAATKMICEATGAQCVGVPSSHVVARRVSHDGRPFAVALSSKRESAHLTVFDADGVAHDAGAIRHAQDLAALGIARLISDDHLPESLRDQAGRISISIQHPIFDPVACLELTLVGPTVDSIALAPFYPREPEAVTRWREIHPN